MSKLFIDGEGRAEFQPVATVSQAKLHIGGDYGSETYIRTVHSDSFLQFRRALRDLNPGHIDIYSPYDCTGLICSQSCKLLSVYLIDGYVVGVVELNVQRDI